MAARLPLLLLALLSLLVSPTAALYEEQAGVFDWRAAHVGPVRSALLRSSPSPRALVSSSRGALASLALDDSAAPALSGEMHWRTMLPEGEGAALLVPYSSVRLLALSSSSSGSGATLRALAAKSGALAWEAELRDPNAASVDKKRIQTLDDEQQDNE